MLYSVLFAAASGLVIEIILFNVVFPLVLGKESRALKEALTRVSNEGYTPEVIDMLTKQYNEVLRIDTAVGFANSYAIYLCDAYTVLRDYARAIHYNNSVNTEELFRYDTRGMHHEQVIWYAQRIQLAALTGDIHKCEHFLRESDAFFRSVRGNSPIHDYMMDSALYEYYFALGDYARCEALITPYLRYTELKYSVYISVGRVYAARGDTYTANKYFDSAVLSAKNDFFKNVAENERRIAVKGEGK